MRQMVLADDDLDIHAEIVFVAKNLDHASLGVVRGRRPRGNLDIDYHSFQVAPFAAMGFLAIHAIAVVRSGRWAAHLTWLCLSASF